MTIKFFVQPEKAEETSLKLLFTNLSLIQQHSDLILNTPEYYNIHIRGCGVFALYIPTFSLFLGDLLQLWAESDWKQSDDYFYCITGSPLSGSNLSRYWNQAVGLEHKSTTTFSRQIKSAICLLNTGSAAIPDGCIAVNIPKRIASDLSIEELIGVLKGF